MYAIRSYYVRPAQRVAPLAERIAALERDGVAVANEGKYHGQFQYRNNFV